MIQYFKKYYLVLLLGILFFSQCVPPQEKEIISDINLDIQDKILQNILSFQDKGQRDSLYKYFNHENPAYRYKAVLAFASTTDSLGIDSLGKKLQDNALMVRNAAAFALGQIGNIRAEKYLLNAYERNDSTGIFHQFNATVMEAIGKCGSDSTLTLLTSVKSFTEADSALNLGQALGIYRYALRGIVRAEGTTKMINNVINSTLPKELRSVSAHYLARAKNIYVDSIKASNIARIFSLENNINIKAPLALALGKQKLLMQKLRYSMLMTTPIIA